MSYGLAMQVQGMAAGRDRARGYRRQNEQDEMAAETHEMEMETRGLQNENLGLRVEGNKFANERAGTLAERQDKQYEIDEKIQAGTIAMRAGLMQYATSGDPSGLISAYNTHVPDGGEITGYELIEPKSEEEGPKIKLKFKSGNEQVMTEKEIGGLGRFFTEPENILEVREARRQQVAAQEAELAKERRELGANMAEETHKTNEEIRKEQELVDRGLKIPEGAEPGGMKTADSNYFQSYAGKMFGGKYEDGMLVGFGEDKRDEAANFMAVAENAFQAGYPRADAAALAYYATDGVVSETKAKEMAEKEYVEARQAGKKPGKKSAYIEARVPELVEQSLWAKREVERKGLDRFSAQREGTAHQGAQQQGRTQQGQPDQGLMVDPDSELGQLLVEP